MSRADLDDFGESLCCPDQRRFEGRETVSGHCITDLHLHLGLYRGIVLENTPSGIKQRVMFWMRGGKLSANADHPYDVRRPAA